MESHQKQAAYLKTYEDLETRFRVQDELLESNLTELKDFDGKTMELFSYQYTMGGLDPFSVLVKKGGEKNKLTAEAYSHRLQLKHPILLPIINFYEKGSNHNGWFIFSLVQGSLSGWLNTKGGSFLFKGVGPKRTMAPLLSGLLTDIWCLLKKMFDMELCPEKMKLDDLFVKLLNDGTPRIQMIITQCARPNSFRHNIEWNRIWTEIDAIIDRCCRICGVELSESSKLFCKFLPGCHQLRIAKNYPIDWSYNEKACYLYHLISATPFTRYLMRSKINEDSGLQWPKGANGEVLGVLQRILNLQHNNIYDEKGNWVCCKYNKKEAYDYVQLCRNNHKHFDDLPAHIKAVLGGTCASLIRCMETWEPNIWIMLYEAVGPAGPQLDAHLS